MVRSITARHYGSVDMDGIVRKIHDRTILPPLYVVAAGRGPPVGAGRTDTTVQGDLAGQGQRYGRGGNPVLARVTATERRGLDLFGRIAAPPESPHRAAAKPRESGWQAEEHSADRDHARADLRFTEVAQIAIAGIERGRVACSSRTRHDATSKVPGFPCGRQPARELRHDASFCGRCGLCGDRLIRTRRGAERGAAERRKGGAALTILLYRCPTVRSTIRATFALMDSWAIASGQCFVVRFRHSDIFMRTTLRH
jgi:hypothetical protein